MKEFIKIIKEGLKDPKKKAITQLILYIIFFTFVFLLISNSNNKSNYKPNNEIVNDTLYYDYEININENNMISNITGIYSEDSELFNYNNIEYNVLDIQDRVIENPLKYNISDYYYENIEELINKSEFVEKTIYKDSNTKTTYNIKINNYYDNCIENCDSNIVINVFENEFINNVIIDLTGVYNYNYVIDIKYKNIIRK